MGFSVLFHSSLPTTASHPPRASALRRTFHCLSGRLNPLRNPSKEGNSQNMLPTCKLAAVRPANHLVLSRFQSNGPAQSDYRTVFPVTGPTPERRGGPGFPVCPVAGRSAETGEGFGRQSQSVGDALALFMRLVARGGTENGEVARSKEAPWQKIHRVFFYSLSICSVDHQAESTFMCPSS
jgi:hypothetical protein